MSFYEEHQVQINAGSIPAFIILLIEVNVPLV
jgi:hypothetical protein